LTIRLFDVLLLPDELGGIYGPAGGVGVVGDDGIIQYSTFHWICVSFLYSLERDHGNCYYG